MTQRDGHVPPAVTVLLPVYNAGALLQASIQSILDQTFTDFELIIINDGSTDGSAEVIRSFNDPRIRYIEQQNQGLARTLNRGIAEAKCDLIARHDHDDLAHPHRLARQVGYMMDHPEIGLLGTWATRISVDGKPIGALEHATDHDSILYHSFFDSPFVHPSVIFRKALVQKAGLYDPDPALFEDLEMWHRLLRIATTANLPEHLVYYRDVISGMSNSTPKRDAQLMECRRRNLLHYFPDLNVRELDILSRLGIGHPMITSQELLATHARMDIFIEENVKDLHVRRTLRKDLRQKLMSYWLIPHRTELHRALDKIQKIAVLSFSRSPLT